MRRLSSPFTAFAITALMATGVAAETPAQPPPAPLTNLTVYPKDIPRPQLITTMQSFVAALGVQAQGGCGYCHVGSAPQFDFASDANPKKNVARKMILMSREISAKLPEVTGKPAAEITSLRCATCHRGVAIPKLLPDVLTETATKSGGPAALQQYRGLRMKYYGGQSHDLRQPALLALATPPIHADQPGDS